MKASARTPIIVFGDDWGRHVSTLQHLFSQIIERRPVIWINSYGHRAPSLSAYDLRRAFEKMVAMSSGPRLPQSGARPSRVVEPRALPWHNVAFVRALNGWSLTRDIRRALDDLGCEEAPFLVTGTPVSADLLGELGERASIYFCMDDYAELPGVSKRIIQPLERKLLAKVDAVVATAAALTHLKKPASGKVYHLAQGVNYEHFAQSRAVPAEIAVLPRPWIGFSGGVSEACDIALINAVAEANPSGSVILVGPVLLDRKVFRPPNICLIGARSYEELPAYVQAFQVGIIPYVHNAWTESVDPLKLLEYLAAGIPVVSTAIPEVAKYASAVTVAATRMEFVRAVDYFCNNSDAASVQSRREVARANTWAQRAKRFLDILQEVDNVSGGSVFASSG